jgi:hypothetical protein
MTYQIYSLDFDGGYWREATWGSLPAESGIYCIYAGTLNPKENRVSLRCLLYIGESKNVRTRVPENPKNRRDKWAQELERGEELWASSANISPDGARQRGEAARKKRISKHHIHGLARPKVERESIKASGRRRIRSQGTVPESPA